MKLYGRERRGYPAFTNLTSKTSCYPSKAGVQIPPNSFHTTLVYIGYRLPLAAHLLRIYLLLLTFFPFFFPLCIAFCFSTPLFFLSPAPKLAFCLK